MSEQDRALYDMLPVTAAYRILITKAMLWVDEDIEYEQGIAHAAIAYARMRGLSQVDIINIRLNEQQLFIAARNALTHGAL